MLGKIKNIDIYRTFLQSKLTSKSENHIISNLSAKTVNDEHKCTQKLNHCLKIPYNFLSESEVDASQENYQ